MKRLYVLVAWFVLASACDALPAQDSTRSRVVLVTASDSPLQTQFSVSELRRLFLGIPVRRNGITVIPLINESDRDLYQAFLQKVLFMSDTNYQRQLVIRVFQRGGERPVRIKKERQLIQALRRHPEGVTFMSHSMAEHLSSVRIVQPLW